MDDMRIGVSLVNFHSENEIIEITRKYLLIEQITCIVIVNNEANEMSIRKLSEFKNNRVKIFSESKNLGYSKGNNIGIRYLIEQEKCDYIIISNSDIKVDSTVPSKLVEMLRENPEYGVLAPRMIELNGTVSALRQIELNGKRLVLRLFVKNLDKKTEHRLQINNGICNQSMVQGSFFMVRSEAIKKCGGFDENIFLYREEEILGKRIIKVGYKLGVVVDLYFSHMHDYQKETYKKLYVSLKEMKKSEIYYFSNYLRYNKLQMIFVYIAEELFITKEIIKHFIKR